MLNKDDQPIKETIEKALGDDIFFVKLADDREEIMTYNEIIHAANKKFEDGNQHWAFKDLIVLRKVQHEGEK